MHIIRQCEAYLWSLLDITYELLGTDPALLQILHTLYDNSRSKLKAKVTDIELIRRIGDKVHRQLYFKI